MPAPPDHPVLPGAVIGVLGSGQLGRMFAIAARQMGYRVHTYSPETDTPTGQVADCEWRRDYDNLDAVREFAEGVDVVTFEFENVPAATTEAAGEFCPVRPSGSLLHVTQNRLREKSALNEAGFRVASFLPVRDRAELADAAKKMSAPCVLKTTGWGYDGKGQVSITDTTAASIDKAWAAVGGAAQDRGAESVEAGRSQEDAYAILEAFVNFQRELSVIVARDVRGNMATYGPVENRHRNHILDLTIAPAAVSEDTARDAVEIARGVAEHFDLVGVMCVEMFHEDAGTLLINELAPRPHNSGHYTIDACVTSQFEQQVRAVCGLPLGSAEQLRPAAMVNLLGDLWLNARSPDWSRVWAAPEAKLHLYGKRDPRPGRKMGHITVLADSGQQAADMALALRKRAATVGNGASASRCSCLD